MGATREEGRRKKAEFATDEQPSCDYQTTVLKHTQLTQMVMESQRAGGFTFSLQFS
jgi:hypothetical protein